jgi:hypothetical protein
MEATGKNSFKSKKHKPTSTQQKSPTNKQTKRADNKEAAKEVAEIKVVNVEKKGMESFAILVSHFVIFLYLGVIGIVREVFVSLKSWVRNAIGYTLVALKWTGPTLIAMMLLASFSGHSVSHICTFSPAISSLFPICPWTTFEAIVPWEGRPQDVQQAISEMYQTKLEAMQLFNAENSEIWKLILSSKLKLRDLATITKMTHLHETYAKLSLLPVLERWVN